MPERAFTSARLSPCRCRSSLRVFTALFRSIRGLADCAHRRISGNSSATCLRIFRQRSSSPPVGSRLRTIRFPMKLILQNKRRDRIHAVFVDPLKDNAQTLTSRCEPERERKTAGTTSTQFMCPKQHVLNILRRHAMLSNVADVSMWIPDYVPDCHAHVPGVRLYVNTPVVSTPDGDSMVMPRLLGPTRRGLFSATWARPRWRWR
jgi:hypothetical protein